MNLPSKTTQSLTKKIVIAAGFFVLVFVCFSDIRAQNGEIFTLTADILQDGKIVALSDAGWKYHAGDDVRWANPQFDDSSWEKLDKTIITPDLLSKSDWRGRAWFRLHFRVDDSLADKTFALVAAQRGASEVYLDGRRLAEFGKITDSEIIEYNPGGVPIPFRFETVGEHILAIRFASETFADLSDIKAKWLTNGEIYPSFTYFLQDADDTSKVIIDYANSASMRGGFLFVGILTALAFLHFMLYLFYRAERANLFYSFYAAGFALFLLCGNLMASGHQPIFPSLVISQIRTSLFAFVFVALLAFLHVAFNRRFGKLFWTLTALWFVNTLLDNIFFGKSQIFGKTVFVLIALSIIFFIFILVQSLKRKRFGAWILMIGMQLFSLGMLTILVREVTNLKLPGIVSFTGEISLILAVPIAVSIFLARNFANTNRNLKTQLEQVELLSKQQIEQERRTADLRAENERRAKELEEARQLQLSMLPKKLPKIPNLEIAAYMKPATEVGGDYYDFHTGDDGTLTVAVGDATGHGLKAGTVVTATKSLFNSLADAPDILDTLNRMSKSLKAMNLRGLFMAMALLKIKDNEMDLSIAGMPSVLIYQAENGKIKEIAIRAMPLGGLSNFSYRQQKIKLFPGDVVLLMSDGFPEMFNEENEILGFEKAAEILPEIAHKSPQEIINQLVKIAETWANGRPQDDDVTFVVLKFGDNDEKNKP